MGSLCAAGDKTANMKGTPHKAFLDMLVEVASTLDIKLFVWDTSMRVLPCRRAKGKKRGGCSQITAAELWLGLLLRGVILSVITTLAKGSVRSIVRVLNASKHHSPTSTQPPLNLLFILLVG